MLLYEHDGSYTIHINGDILMDSKLTESEIVLGRVGVEKLTHGDGGRVLIGGLGLGYTLRSVLNEVDEEAVIDVAELMPAVVEWNRTHLVDLNGRLLRDPQVELYVEDVADVIREAPPGNWDVILLDVDNGPDAMVVSRNDSLYGHRGLRVIRDALAPGGRAVFWSAGPDQAFEERLEKVGFDAAVIQAKRRKGAKRAACTLFIADKID